MGGRLRVDVVKGQRMVRLVHLAARNLAAQDAREDIVRVILTQRLDRHVSCSLAILPSIAGSPARRHQLTRGCRQITAQTTAAPVLEREGLHIPKSRTAPSWQS